MEIAALCFTIESLLFLIPSFAAVRNIWRQDLCPILPADIVWDFEKNRFVRLYPSHRVYLDCALQLSPSGL